MIFVMTIPDPDNGRPIGIYSVSADSPEEARQKIIAELTPKPHRQSILKRWFADGQPVREAGKRKSATSRIDMAGSE